MTSVRGPFDSVVVAISAFRSESDVLEKLQSIFSPGVPAFLAVVVVDSLSDGSLGRAIDENGWRVLYDRAEHNLGSAGNLSRRLELARSLGGRWCYAINHDGFLDIQAVRAMVQLGETAPRIGAVYPNRFRPNRGSTWEAPRRARGVRLFSPRLRAASKSGGDVLWSSSNGALYSLEPLAEGVRVWEDLWMGWEDFGYGLLLKDAGWRQVICLEAVFIDTYEYKKVSMFGKAIYIADKPPWYNYYSIRNLILISRRVSGGRLIIVNSMLIVAKEIATTILYRSERLTRIALLARGVWHGLRNIRGKREFP